MATTTRPAKAWETPEGVHRRFQRHDEPVGDEARSAPAAASIPMARPMGQRGASWPAGSLVSSFASRRRENGSDAAKRASSTTETITENVVSCSETGECTKWASEGITQAVTDSSIRTTMVRARSEPSCWVPCLRPPTKNARPSTSSRLARIDPTRAPCTTPTSPALSEKMQMNSSGRFPSADCRTPVAPAPNRSPSCSTDRPTSEASRQIAPAATTNASTELRSA